MPSQVKPYRVLSSNRLDLLRLQVVAEEYRERVGKRIKEARQAKGWTQAQLARALPGTVDGPSVSRWERGGAMPQPDNLDALAAALDVDASFFLVEAPQAGPGDLMGTLNGAPTSLPSGLQKEIVRVHSRLDELSARMEEMYAAIMDAVATGDQQRAKIVELGQALERLPQPDATAAARAPRKRKTARG